MGLDIQSKEVIDKISDELKVQPALSIPRELMDKIQLVYGVNPERHIKSIRGVLADATSGSFFTTHATKRTFMIGASLSITKDVVNDSTRSTLQASLKANMTGKRIIEIIYAPLAIGNFNKTISFPLPVELEKSTTIIITHETNTASIDGAAIVFFYETDPL